MSRAIATSCCVRYWPVYRGKSISDHSGLQNPFTDFVEKRTEKVHSGYVPPAYQIWFRYAQRSLMCVFFPFMRLAH